MESSQHYDRAGPSSLNRNNLSAVTFGSGAFHSGDAHAPLRSLSDAQDSAQTSNLESKITFPPEIYSPDDGPVHENVLSGSYDPSSQRSLHIFQSVSSIQNTQRESTHPSTSKVPEQQWIVSASRPENPEDAFSITISPRANPPPRIVSGAYSGLHISNLTKCKSHARLPNGNANINHTADIVNGHNKSLSVQMQTSPTNSAMAGSISINSMPSSPQSTNTSFSVLSPSQSAYSTPNTASLVLPSSSADVSAAGASKKSWASLLGPNGTSSSKLPTSSIVGFSVPASQDSNESSSPHVPINKKPGLIALLSSGPSGSSNVPAIRPRGLVNTGNMCFANSVLQVLTYCGPFNRFFGDLGKHLGHSKSDVSGVDKLPMTRATVRFLKEFRFDTKNGDESREWLDSFIPTYMYEAMKEKKRFDAFRGGHQEDAEEFLGFFLDALEEEVLELSNSLGAVWSKKATKEAGDDDDSLQNGWVEVGKRNRLVSTRNTNSAESPITRMFNGKFRSTLKVPGQRDSVILEDWRALPLDIQREQISSIEGALKNMSHPQAVQVSSVTKGGAIVDATQHILVDALPPILVLHLKRFLYDTKTYGVVKIGKQIGFRPELEIPSDAITPARRSSQPVKYKLFAVVYHHGSSASGGHYTLDVLHPNRNENQSSKAREGWIRIDDELISDLRSEDVFETNYDDRCAYLLFYKRIGGYLRTADR